MTITVHLSPILEKKMPPPRARWHFAIGAFAAEDVTLGQAAEIAGVSQAEFMAELARRKIPLHYDSAEFAEDLEAIKKLSAIGGHVGDL